MTLNFRRQFHDGEPDQRGLLEWLMMTCDSSVAYPLTPNDNIMLSLKASVRFFNERLSYFDFVREIIFG